MIEFRMKYAGEKRDDLQLVSFGFELSNFFGRHSRSFSSAVGFNGYEASGPGARKIKICYDRKDHERMLHTVTVADPRRERELTIALKNLYLMHGFSEQRTDS